MWTAVLLLAGLQPALAGTAFEDVVQHARAASPTTQMSEEDLTIAKHRVGQSVARLMPVVTVSDTQSFRFNNPERYTFTVEPDEDRDSCDPETSPFCLPLAFDGAQVTLPENTLANQLNFRAVLPVSSTAIAGVAQQKLGQEQTENQVQGQDERLVLDLVYQYAELQYGVGALEMYEQSLALAEETLEAVRGERAAGQATDLEVDQATLDVDEAALAIAQLDRSLPLGVERLAAISGSDRNTGIQVCPFAENIDVGVELDVDEATSLVSAETDLKMDRLRRTSARLAALPTLNVVAGAAYTGNGATLDEQMESFLFDNWYVGATLSLTVFDGLGRHHSRREASANLRKGELELKDRRRQLELDTKDQALALTDLAEQLVVAERGLTLQQREVEATRARYFESGDASFQMYTQARSMYEQWRLQQLNLQRQQLQLTAQRWIRAGHGDALLDELFVRERAHAAAANCRDLTST